MPVLGGVGQGREPAPGPPSPEGARAFDEVVTQFGVAGDGTGVQQPDGRLGVGVGHGQGLLHGAHAAVEGQARVPDGIPETRGDGADVAPAPVHEDEVDVAVRAELAPAEGADGDQAHALLVTQQAGQPRLDQGGVGPAEGAAGQAAIGQQGVARCGEILRARRCPSRRCGSG